MNATPDSECLATMILHDVKTPLERWFHDWKTDPNATFAGRYEFLEIDDRPAVTARGREVRRYVGRIGSDDEGARPRAVSFELGAPPPPSFYRAAETRPKAPPPWWHGLANPFATSEAVFNIESRYIVPGPGITSSMLSLEGNSPTKRLRNYFLHYEVRLRTLPLPAAIPVSPGERSSVMFSGYGLYRSGTAGERTSDPDRTTPQQPRMRNNR